MMSSIWDHFGKRLSVTTSILVISLREWVKQVSTCRTSCITRKGLARRVNQWLKRFGINYSLRVKRRKDVFALQLLDSRRGTELSHVDVGFGISQLLPIIVQCLAVDDKLIIVEQPEIHLHPRLQSELGSFLIEAAETTKNRFLIETHSEHLLLRIQRRMRETQSGLAPKRQTVTPGNVDVLYVEPQEDRSTVRRMPLRPNGALAKAWPGGFFEEGLEEVL